jgi:predicted DNA-binding transcriptional regulator AlpA
MKNENLLRPEAAAKLIGVSPNTFSLMQAKSQLPAPVMIGQRKFWLKAILNDWIAGGFQVIS